MAMVENVTIEYDMLESLRPLRLRSVKQKRSFTFLSSKRGVLCGVVA